MVAQSRVVIMESIFWRTDYGMRQWARLQRRKYDSRRKEQRATQEPSGEQSGDRLYRELPKVIAKANEDDEGEE